LFTREPKRIDKAVKNIAEDQQEQVIDAYTLNKQADKQRLAQAHKPESLPRGRKKELPMRRGTVLPGKPTELPGRRKEFKNGQTPEIEPPK